jgi:hypothetical protein
LFPPRRHATSRWTSCGAATIDQRDRQVRFCLILVAHTFHLGCGAVNTRVALGVAFVDVLKEGGALLGVDPKLPLPVIDGVGMHEAAVLLKNVQNWIVRNLELTQHGQTPQSLDPNNCYCRSMEIAFETTTRNTTTSPTFR